jgi:hypothetical protein
LFFGIHYIASSFVTKAAYRFLKQLFSFYESSILWLAEKLSNQRLVQMILYQTPLFMVFGITKIKAVVYGLWNYRNYSSKLLAEAAAGLMTWDFFTNSTRPILPE